MNYLPMMKLQFRIRDIYGMDLPDLRAEFEILRDLTYPEHGTLPDVYLEGDRDRYNSGMWQFVTVRLSLYNDTDHVVARSEREDVEFGEMWSGYVNPLANPDDFPMQNLFRDAIDEYEARDGMPL